MSCTFDVRHRPGGGRKNAHHSRPEVGKGTCCRQPEHQLWHAIPVNVRCERHTCTHRARNIGTYAARSAKTLMDAVHRLHSFV